MKNYNKLILVGIIFTSLLVLTCQNGYSKKAKDLQFACNGSDGFCGITSDGIPVSGNLVATN